MVQILIKTSLIAGTLDILAACLSNYFLNGVTPDRLLKFVASGVFGKTAFAGGYGMMAWGLLFHFMIAAACVVCYFSCIPNCLF